MPFWVVSATSAALLAALCVFLWLRRPPAPLWPIVFVCQLFALLWVAGDLWASHARGPVEKQIALAVLFSGSIPLAAAWWETARRYVIAHGLGQPWMRSRWSRLPLGFAALAWIFALTNAYHGALLTPVVGGPNVYHGGFAIVLAGSYAIGLATVSLCAWAARRHASPEVGRKMTILAAATLAPIASHAAHLTLRSVAREDAAAIGLGAASVAILYGLYRKRLFNPLPIALTEILRRDPAALLVLEPGGRLLLWNPAAEKLLSGVPLEPDGRVLDDLAGRLERSERDARPRTGDELLRMVGESTSADRDVFRLRGHPEEHWLELSRIPVPSRRGRLAAMCLRVEDVTDRERAERERRELAEEVRQSEKLKSLGLLAGGVAHDFNNLLTAIAGNAQLAARDLAEGDPARGRLADVLEATELAADLTQQLLAFAGRARIEMEPVDLAELVSDMSRLLEHSLPPEVALRTNLDPELPAVQGDPTQLCQVVVNLLTNAVEALGDEPGFVTIQASAAELDAGAVRRTGLEGQLAPGSFVRLEVSDSGQGMDEATRSRVFDPFFSTKRVGRGLGLAAAFGLVRGHRGAIDVESEPGVGTTFRIWLPASSRRPEPARRAPASSLAGWRGSGAILVVDDVERVRRLAAAVLEEVGFEVLTAADGEEALRILRRHRGRIRLVLLDCTMPGLSGDATLGTVTALDPELPVLLSSGYDESDALSRLPADKVAGFLHKPWSPDALVAAVRRLLDPPRG